MDPLLRGLDAETILKHPKPADADRLPVSPGRPGRPTGPRWAKDPGRRRTR